MKRIEWRRAGAKADEPVINFPKAEIRVEQIVETPRPTGNRVIGEPVENGSVSTALIAAPICHIHWHIQGDHAMPLPSAAGAREAKLFRNNRSQAVRIPVEFELPGDKVLIHREGSRLVIEPVPRKNLLDILRALEPLGAEDAFPGDIDAGLLPPRDIDL